MATHQSKVSATDWPISRSEVSARVINQLASLFVPTLSDGGNMRALFGQIASAVGRFSFSIESTSHLHAICMRLTRPFGERGIGPTTK